MPDGPAAHDDGIGSDVAAAAGGQVAPKVQLAEDRIPKKFADFPVGQAIKDALSAMGYETPTDVQAQVILPAIDGRDLLVQSKTGSGKTSAFGIVVMQKMQAQLSMAKCPQALVLAPTRELAHQVATELKALGQFSDTRVLAIYGGVPMGRQVSALKAGVDVVVATPGRLLDHLRRNNLSFKNIQTIVLDEADEMLSMGFWEDVTELIKRTPKTRQTLLFSATLPYEVAKSAAHLLQNAVKVDVSGDDLNVDGIQNTILHVVPDLPKPRQMLYVLEGEAADSAIIFCNTRNETEMLAKYLTQSGFVAEPISGNLKQKDRDRTMARIKSGELRYMVATDIAARGIDINDLSHVFNYSLPEFCEVYLHRVGRTGRIGKMGRAVSLVDGKGLGTLSVLEREFNVKFIEKTLPPEEDVKRARSQRIMKDLAEKAAMAELQQHLPVAQDILQQTDAPKVVAFLLKSYFNSQAQTARRVGTDAEGLAHEPALAEVSLEGSEDLEAAQGTDNNKRRRRRRRGRGQKAEGAHEQGQAAPVSRQARPAKAVDSERPQGRRARHDNFEIVDAAQILGLVAPQAEPARDIDEAMAPVPRPRSNEPRAAPRAPAPKASPPPQPAADGLARLRVNVGFDDGFKGRGAVAKKISALAGLNEGIVAEQESRRDHAILRASKEIADLVLDRVDGAQLGKKVITVSLL